MHNLKNKFASFLSIRLKNIKSGYFGRERFWLFCLIYRLLPYLGLNYSRLHEWKYILDKLPRRHNQRILDVGSCESLFIYRLSSYGMVTGTDIRPYSERLPKGMYFVASDCLHPAFLESSFDVITLVSVIEHVGLGFYGDSIAEQGDLLALSGLGRVLKKDGLIFVTTQVAKDYVVSQEKSERIYNRKRFDELFKGLRIMDEKYYIFRKKWIPTTKELAFLEAQEKFAIACVLAKKE